MMTMIRSQKRASIAFFLIGALSAASTVVRAASDNRHMRVEELKGDSARAISNDKKERRLKEGDEVTQGDSIQTGERTVVTLGLFDGSRLRIAPNSTLSLSSIKGDKRSIVRWDLSLGRGAVSGSVVEKDSQKRKEDLGIKISIQTKIAAMGVRGTQFIFAHEEGDGKERPARTELHTKKGEVLFSKDKDFREESTVIVGEGYWAFLEAKIAKPAAPQKIDANGGFEASLNKFGLSEKAAERRPQSVDASPKECIAKKMGWRQKAGSSSPVGECY